MGKVYFRLSSRQGDRLGHLIRGVQMLGLYGTEANLTGCSDVLHNAIPDGKEGALTCVLEAESSATEEGLIRICREAEWSMGGDEEVLKVSFEYREAPPAEMQSRPGGQSPLDGAAVFMAHDRFAKLFDWGPQPLGVETVLMSKWPHTGQ